MWSVKMNKLNNFTRIDTIRWLNCKCSLVSLSKAAAFPRLRLLIRLLRNSTSKVCWSVSGKPKYFALYALYWALTALLRFLLDDLHVDWKCLVELVSIVSLSSMPSTWAMSAEALGNLAFQIFQNSWYDLWIMTYGFYRGGSLCNF